MCLAQKTEKKISVGESLLAPACLFPALRRPLRRGWADGGICLFGGGGRDGEAMVSMSEKERKATYSDWPEKARGKVSPLPGVTLCQTLK